ncbi:hypothetical protein UFOVP276_166 [uncultured Caudovirales phage]|uniref:Uncharacterized protein n=1 Tax=uncultured Caudovirales phage TaxID=2100421 RepID=A0A6J5LB31_9CAUD|nr:hypothetical protein UFOVP127_60 [uncultured Caudovirales phage]CAB4135210.1 hypothetical protein UFOVP276_166 [uncultured Caudovirales phage]
MDAIILEYSRKPMTTNYVATIRGGQVDGATKSIDCSDTLQELSATTMEHILEALQKCMLAHPDAKVFMMQTPFQEKAIRMLPMHELDGTIKDLIRDRLPEAIQVFSPIQM